MRAVTLAALPLLGLSFAACATDGIVDELAVEDDDDDAAADGKADATPDGPYTYFAVRSDLRKCAAPYCGGFFVERVNRSTTVCHDGTVAEACYVPELDWAEAALSDASRALLVDAAGRAALGSGAVTALVRGRIAPTNGGQVGGDLGRFVVTEVWLNVNDAVPSGVFAKVRDAGVVCFAAPCESMIERGLNSSNRAMIAGLDWSFANLAPEAAEGLGLTVFEPGGLIVAGDRYTMNENGRTARGRTATAVFRKVDDAAAD